MDDSSKSSAAPATNVATKVVWPAFMGERKPESTFAQAGAEILRLHNQNVQINTLAWQATVSGMVKELAQWQERYKFLSQTFHDKICGEQAAYIEWKHGKGADAGMQWIANGLAGPGLIPHEDAPWGKEAQAFFDANQSEPFPVCACGRPSNIGWMEKGFCGKTHYDEAKAAFDAKQSTEQTP